MRFVYNEKRYFADVAKHKRSRIKSEFTIDIHAFVMKPIYAGEPIVIENSS